MANVCFTSQELDHLLHLSHRAQVLYLQVLKPRMDYKTGIAGITHRISEQACKEHLEVHPEQGGNPPPDSTRAQIRAALKQLERNGLIERIPFKPMTWHLPLVRGPVACVLSQKERDGVLYLSHRAQVLYLHMKATMDPKSGVVGRNRCITNATLMDWISVHPCRGSKAQAFTANRDHCRASLDQLARHGMIQRASVKTRSLAIRLLKIDAPSPLDSVSTLEEPTLTDQPKPARTTTLTTVYATESVGCIDKAAKQPTHQHTEAPTDEQPTSFSYKNNTIQIVPGCLCITLDWEPSDAFKQRLKNLKIPYPPDVVLSFVMYWTGETTKGRFLTQHQWEAKLLEQIILKTGKQKWRFAKSQPTTVKPAPRPNKQPSHTGQTENPVYSEAWKHFDDLQRKPQTTSKATGIATLAALKSRLAGKSGGNTGRAYPPPASRSQGANKGVAINPREAIERCYQRINR